MSRGVALHDGEGLFREQRDDRDEADDAGDGTLLGSVVTATDIGCGAVASLLRWTVDDMGCHNASDDAEVDDEDGGATATPATAAAGGSGGWCSRSTHSTRRCSDCGVSDFTLNISREGSTLSRSPGEELRLKDSSSELFDDALLADDGEELDDVLDTLLLLAVLLLRDEVGDVDEESCSRLLYIEFAFIPFGEPHDTLQLTKTNS